MNFSPWSGEVVSAGILTLVSAAASPASVGSSRSEQPADDRDTKLQQPAGLAASAWPIVVAIAAALCVMAAVSAWDKKHKG